MTPAVTTLARLAPMHVPPADLSDAELRTALIAGWRIEPSSRAPVQHVNGGLLQMSGRYAIAVYPYLDVVAETTEDHAADRVVDLIIALHAATPAVEQIAAMDDFALPGRWSVQHLLDASHVDPPTGPYAASFHDLIADHLRILSEALLEYDRMASLMTGRSHWLGDHARRTEDQQHLDHQQWAGHDRLGHRSVSSAHPRPLDDGRT
jgi:hypothetical protein